MEYYIKRFSALFCLVAVLTSNGADGALTSWDTVAARLSTDAVVATRTASGTATDTAAATLRDGLTSADGIILTITATAATVTYSLDAMSDVVFDIANNPAELVVTANAVVSYATQSTYTVIVTGTDGGDTGTLTLTLTVNGMPTFASVPPCLNIADATAVGATLYTYVISDPETAGAVTTTIASGDASTYFTSPITGGELVTSKVMAKATDPSFTLGIKAVDAGTPQSTASTTVTVNVLDAGAIMGTCPILGGTCAIDAECTTTVANAICGSDTPKVCECDAANGYIVNAGTCEKSATACTSDTQCNSDSFEDCSTVNSANICKCKTGYTDNAGTCEAKNACTVNTDCTSTNHEACTTITGATKACRCATNYTDNGGTCLSDCLDDPTPQHGSISAGSNSVGSNRTVTCDSDYTLTGVETITCKTDSTWETPGTCNGAESILGGTIFLSLSSLVVMVIYI